MRELGAPIPSFPLQANNILAKGCSPGVCGVGWEGPNILLIIFNLIYCTYLGWGRGGEGG